MKGGLRVQGSRQTDRHRIKDREAGGIENVHRNRLHC
jgi:hypothetical protein